MLQIILVQGFRPLKINFPDGFRVKRAIAYII